MPRLDDWDAPISSRLPKRAQLWPRRWGIFWRMRTPRLWKNKREHQKDFGKTPFSKLDMEEFNGDNLLKLFDSPNGPGFPKPVWDAAPAPLCPTCQCYDIRDFNTGHGIQRFRCWDSCMYSDFTTHGPWQPRPDAAGAVPPAVHA